MDFGSSMISLGRAIDKGIARDYSMENRQQRRVVIALQSTSYPLRLLFPFAYRGMRCAQLCEGGEIWR